MSIRGEGDALKMSPESLRPDLAIIADNVAPGAACSTSAAATAR
jgi:hypothetical protein